MFEVIEGETITIGCPVEAVPLPKIEWIRDENQIQSNDHIRIVTPESKVIKKFILK